MVPLIGRAQYSDQMSRTRVSIRSLSKAPLFQCPSTGCVQLRRPLRYHIRLPTSRTCPCFDRRRRTVAAHCVKRFSARGTHIWSGIGSAAHRKYNFASRLSRYIREAGQCAQLICLLSLDAIAMQARFKGYHPKQPKHLKMRQDIHASRSTSSNRILHLHILPTSLHLRTLRPNFPTPLAHIFPLQHFITQK